MHNIIKCKAAMDRSQLTDIETETELASMHDSQYLQVQLKLALHISCMSIVSQGNLKVKLIADVGTAEAAPVGTVRYCCCDFNWPKPCYLCCTWLGRRDLGACRSLLVTSASTQVYGYKPCTAEVARLRPAEITTTVVRCTAAAVSCSRALCSSCCCTQM